MSTARPYGSRSSARTWRRTPASPCTSAARPGASTAPIHSLVDYNRAGIPLIEIVTKPIEGAGAHAPDVARAYVAHLRELVRGLGVSDVRMDQGSLRCDVNLSLRSDRPHRWEPAARRRTSTRCARSSEQSATRSRVRQRLLDAGRAVVQETRHWHEDTGVTTSGREQGGGRGLPLLPRARPRARSRPTREWVEALRADARPSHPRTIVRGCRPTGGSPTSRCVTSSARVPLA